jgi:hypothetical protein
MNPGGFGADGGGETVWNIFVDIDIIVHVHPSDRFVNR